MELVKALKMLRGQRGSRMNFWYCAGDCDGEPLLMLDKKKISPKERQVAMKAAKKKQFSSGSLVWDEGDALEVAPNGGVPAGFDKSLKKIVKKHVTPPKEIKLVELAPAPAEPEELARKALGKNYAGEDKSFAWRADALPDDRLPGFIGSLKSKKPEALVSILGLNSEDELDGALAGKSPAELREIARKFEGYVTKYFGADEKEASRVRVGADGLLRDDAGELLGDGAEEKKGYVMDPETGQAHTFEGGGKRTATGIEMTHHSSPLAGGDVAGAGHIKVEDGRITEIDDMSGHYKPDAQKTLQVLRRLEKLGAKLVDDRLVDETGYELDEELSKKYRLLEEYEKQRKVLLGQLLRSWKEAAAEAEGKGGKAPARPELPPYDPDMEKLRLELSDEGAGPANKSPKVKLVGKKGLSEEEFAKTTGNLQAINAVMEAKSGRKDLLPPNTDKRVLDNLPALNLTIGERLSVELSKEQFEQTEGNEDQIRNKQNLNKDLEKELEKERKGLNAEAKQARKDLLRERVAARVKELGAGNEREALAKVLGVRDVEALDDVSTKEVLRALLDPRVVERIRPQVDKEARVLGAIQRQGGRGRADIRKAACKFLSMEEDDLSTVAEFYLVDVLLGLTTPEEFKSALSRMTDSGEW